MWQEAGWFLMWRYCVNSRMWSDVFYGLLQSLLSASVRISHARIPDSPSFSILPGKSSCRNAWNIAWSFPGNPLLRIWNLHGRRQTAWVHPHPCRIFLRCTYPRPGVFADMDFAPFMAFRLFRCATLPQGYFCIVVNLPIFTCSVMPQCLKRLVVHVLNLTSPVFTSTQSPPCISYLMPFLSRDTNGTREKFQSTMLSPYTASTKNGRERSPYPEIKKQTVTCMGIPVGTCLFDMFHHRVHFLYVFPDKPVYPVTPVVQTDECFLAILLFCLNHDLFYFMVKHAQLW